MISIYALLNPITNSYFYVGVTGLTLQKRLNCHMSSTDANKEKVATIKSILNCKLRPEIILLELVNTSDEGNKQEMYWISKLKQEGHILTNKALKGAGRRASANAKIQVNLYLTQEDIDKFGDEEKLKEFLYEYIN